MKSYRAILVLFLLIITLSSSGRHSKQTTQKFLDAYDRISQSQSIFTAFDQLFRLNGMSPSFQIRTCLTKNQQDSLNTLFSTLIAKAISTSQGAIKFYPSVFKIKTQQKISKQSIQCLLGTNDMAMLKSKFDIAKNQQKSVASIMEQKFVKYGEDNYRTLQQMLGNIFEAFQQMNYKKTGQLLNTYGHVIYGNVRADDPWIIRVQNVQKLTEYFGVTVSNGIIGAISSTTPLKLKQTVIGGAYDKVGRGRVDNIIQAFSVLDLQVQCGDGWWWYNYLQQLNIKQGKMSGSYSTSYCSIQYEYSAVKNLPFAFLTTLKVTSHVDNQITIKNIHEAPDYLNNVQKSFEDIDTDNEAISIVHSKGTTKSGKLDICMASSFIFSEQLRKDTSLRFTHEDWDSNRHFSKLRKNIKKGQTVQVSVITSLMTSQHHSDPLNQAMRIVIRGVSMGTEAIKRIHQKEWKNLWTNDIIIQGNQEDQKNVRLMLYHFYSFLNSQKPYGLSPMGLSGLGYNGHIFWDMDLWMYPAILALKPDIAKVLIQYRIERLDAAKNNAFINGYKGSMFPWESSMSGQQQTPIWALTGPLQHHISGCVSFAVWNYYQVTQDKQWLSSKGYQVIRSVAEFWESRVELNEKDNLYHINNVVGADQWAENINDDAFTNAVAIKSFEIANKASAILGKPQNQRWKQISQKIAILHFDSGVTKQHATYNGQNIKQADVNLLAYPLNIISDPTQILRDLKFYQVKIPDQGTPAMTFSIFTILYSRLKNPDQAYAFFKQSHRQNLRKPFNVFSETKGGTNPYFLTGAGGVLQSVIFGFGGYNITDQGIKKINTVIPRQWTSLTIKGFLNENFTSQKI